MQVALGEGADVVGLAVVELVENGEEVLSGKKMVSSSPMTARWGCRKGISPSQ
jgi:hypothetical protein